MKAWNGPKTSYVTYIVTTAEKLWAALTSAEFTRQYFFGRRIESDWKVGAIVRYWQEDGTLDVEGTILECEPPRRVSYTWRVMWIEEYRNLPPALVTFQLDSLGEVVRLTMTETHDESIQEELLEGGRKGRPVILSGLKSLLETPKFDPFKSE
jgi:uncharacterized protein YndB with AHSA1/START domain